MKIKQNDGKLPVGGFSMIPLLVPGDSIRLKQLNPNLYQVGDIIVCIDEKVRLVVHRIIKIEKLPNKERILITKGDNAVATERIQGKYCLGKVTEVTNKNGKDLKLYTPGIKDVITAVLSKKVNRIYTETCDPNIAFSSKYNMMIFNIASDFLKEYVYDAQNYMIRKTKAYILRLPPEMDAADQKFVFTKDFYAMLINHKVLNILYPYVMEGSGRFGKILKLAKAQKLAAANKLNEWCYRIAEAFDDAGIEYVVYKGIATSYMVYGDTTTREYDDVDFLIKPEDTQKAHTIMNEFGFYNLNAAKGLFRTDEPTEEYATHLTPYVLKDNNVTIEIHTAIYLNEAHTPELLDRKQIIDVQGHRLSILSDIDLCICQLYITAVDDFGCSSMSFEDDPNIFLKLKFRNYVDILLLAYRYQHIPTQEILKLAVKYDINFYLYLSLYYTGKIFEQNNGGRYSGIAKILEPVFKLQNELKQYEELHESFYRFPIDAQSCLQNPFKMKMNGKALLKLRDAFYMSEEWKRRKTLYESAHFTCFEVDFEHKLRIEHEILTQNISLRKNMLKFEFEGAWDILSAEFIIAVKGMNTKKYRKPHDYSDFIYFVYVNKNKMTGIKGRIKVNNIMQWSDRMNQLYGEIVLNAKNGKKAVNKRKNLIFCSDLEINKILPQIIFELNCLNIKKPYGYAYFSTFLFEFSGSKVQKMHEITPKLYENIKISFD